MTSAHANTAAKPPLLTLVFLLVAAVMLIPLDRNVLWLPAHLRVMLGLLAAFWFLWRLRLESSSRQRSYLALAVSLGLLALAPISTNLSTPHVIALFIPFVLVLILPPLILRRPEVITFRFWPRQLDWLDVGYTLSAIPLAWAAFMLYFGVLSPEVPYNWSLSAQPQNAELWRLFFGINAVGIWDELFFINICFAVLRSLFPFNIANPAQAVIYTTVLYDMAFTGWGPLFVYLLALTQGTMYERSRVLLWVLLVHLIVDYFLFQAIIETYYPALQVWWH